MRQLIITLSFLFPSILVGQMVTVSPTTLGCGSNTVSFDYGSCGWTGSASVSFNYSGVTLPNGGGVSVNNGVGTIVLDVASGTTGNFDLTITTGGIGNNPGGCMPTGPPPFSHIETMDVDCATSCSLTASAVVDQDESCAGASDGEATASGANGSGNYAYEWDDPSSQTTATASGLAPGNYTVTVTDTVDGCTATASVTIAAGSTCPTISTTTLGCGQTTVTVDWGCDWNGQTSFFFPNLPAGVTLVGSNLQSVIAGVVTYTFDVSVGSVTAFVLELEITNISQNTGGCSVNFGDIFDPTVTVDCPSPPTVTVSPTTLPCDQTTVTVDYGGCGWTLSLIHI